MSGVVVAVAFLLFIANIGWQEWRYHTAARQYRSRRDKGENLSLAEKLKRDKR